MTARRTATLTGIKPTGALHLGNYAGAIRPLARLAADEDRDVYVFVADLHALNSGPEPALSDRTRRMAAALLACGLDRPNVSVYRQSRVPAIARLAALLNNVTSKGLLNRAHAYKAAVAANSEAGRDRDHGVNMGLYGYPVLMAADILALDADEVPVGADQAQHLEIAIDLAQQFARTYQAGVLRAPQALVTDDVALLPGLDGRKMSKSYDNAIVLMADPKVTADRIRRIVTDSTLPDQPKDPDACTLVALLRAFADAATTHAVETRYRSGGIGYGEVKALLAEVIEQHVAPAPPLRAAPRRPARDPGTTHERRAARDPARRTGARPHDDRDGPLASLSCSRRGACPTTGACCAAGRELARRVSLRLSAAPTGSRSSPCGLRGLRRSRPSVVGCPG